MAPTPGALCRGALLKLARLVEREEEEESERGRAARTNGS